MPSFEFIRRLFLPTELRVLIFVLLFFPGVALIELLVIRLKFGPFSEATDRQEAVAAHAYTKRDTWRGRIPLAIVLFLISFTSLIPAWKETYRRLLSFQTIATVTQVEFDASSSHTSVIESLFSNMETTTIDYSYSVNGSFYTGRGSVCYITKPGRTFSSLRCETYEPRRGDEHVLLVSRADPATSYLPRPFLFNWFSGFLLMGVAALFFFEKGERKEGE